MARQTRERRRISDVLLDELLAGQDASEVFRDGTLIDELKKAVAERALDVEMEAHLGGEAEQESGNHRNGHNRKRMLTEDGALPAGAWTPHSVPGVWASQLSPPRPPSGESLLEAGAARSGDPGPGAVAGGVASALDRGPADPGAVEAVSAPGTGKPCDGVVAVAWPLPLAAILPAALARAGPVGVHVVVRNSGFVVAGGSIPHETRSAAAGLADPGAHQRLALVGAPVIHDALQPVQRVVVRDVGAVRPVERSAPKVGEGELPVPVVPGMQARQVLQSQPHVGGGDPERLDRDPELALRHGGVELHDPDCPGTSGRARDEVG